MIINNEKAYPYKYNKNYYITKSGKIYSMYVVGGRGIIDVNHPHLLSYGKDKDGYYRVVLSEHGRKKYLKVHTIIVEQFIHDIPDGMVVNHKDGDIHNNNVENLEIVTPKENTIHAHKTGLTSKEIKVEVIYNNNKYFFNSLTDCMSTFPEITRHYLNQIKNGIIQFSNVLFTKASDKRISEINCYYNGRLYKTFKTMQDADEYFGMKKGSTSGAMKCNEYRKKINKYNITFPNVSTIESMN